MNNKNQDSHLKKMIGNRSRESVTWINGPMHEVRNQCIPNYTGHIEGVKAENVFGQTYARSSATSFDRAIVKGRDATSPQERFKSVNQMKLDANTTNRRIVENRKFAPHRDYIEYTISMNNNNRQKRDAIIRNISDVREGPAMVSPTRFRRDLSGSIYGHVSDLQVKPGFLESNVGGSPGFKKLSPGFKAVFTQAANNDERVAIPVVGYQGHRKGYQSENFYGKNFRDSAFFAKTNLRKTHY